VKGQIARGERSRALLAQPRFAALRRVDQVALLAALAAGTFDAHPPALLARLRVRLADWLDGRAAPLVQALQGGAALDEATRAALVARVAELCAELAAEAGVAPA
jgi:F-type H+-transporting ATPase subunit alpha